MYQRWFLPGLVATFCILTLGVFYMSRKPVCIDSKVVDRIDRGSEFVFRCSLGRHVAFSTFFSEHLPEIEQRVLQIEKFVRTVSPFKNNYRLVILPNKPHYFLIKDNFIYIGEPLLQTYGHLEKALLKVWYRENAQNLFAYENLFEEVFTDFMLFLTQGKLKIEDPFRGARTKVGGSRWPQVIKSMESYCQSPWKQSEHYQFCSRLQTQPSALNDQITELSVRPLLVSSWVEAYKVLSFKDQYRFVRSLLELLSGDHDPELPLVKTGGYVPQGAPLREASEAVKNVYNFLLSSSLTKDSEAHRIFASLVANNLSRYGFNDALGGVHFDLLIMSEAKVNPKSDQFKHFMGLAKKNPRMSIAVKDSENLWMLPSFYPVRWRSMESIQANRVVYSKCGSYDFNFVWQFATNTEKLMILNVCKDQRFQLVGYLKEGPESFGEQNKDIPFIQFHIPSLLMRKDQLSQVDSVYDLVSRRQLESPGFRSLGWQKLIWSERAQAYQPKSHIDGIEWFKEVQPSRF